jgi:hypothetical protein
MTKSVRLFIASVIITVCVVPSATAQRQARISVPPVPGAIAVPAGSDPFLTGRAIGTQNYICQISGTSLFWKFLGPQATLFIANGNEVYQQIATHFLSVNPFESNAARPTWQSSFDTSSVWGFAVSSSTDPNYVSAGAIPWLLLQAVGTQLGPTGGSTLAQTTFVQRINTAGGMAPSTGCSVTGNVGNVVFVPYTADYYFFRAAK